ncbi:hypothetical protein, partial [Massilia sp. S19_KUP03_FR1]|uniref:hypothetical protein n=1 Tax=Massilia sp. S19_KUP03_FR1 TaxID=3025503 RepID=UPI002FCD9C5D
VTHGFARHRRQVDQTGRAKSLAYDVLNVPSTTIVLLCILGLKKFCDRAMQRHGLNSSHLFGERSAFTIASSEFIDACRQRSPDFYIGRPEFRRTSS